MLGLAVERNQSAFPFVHAYLVPDTLSFAEASLIVVEMRIAFTDYLAALWQALRHASESREDVSCQLLQPIHDTSTHRPFDSRTLDFHRAGRGSL
jgi:hypothetical protein